MKSSTIMSIAAVLAALFGLAFFLVPVQTMAVYGITLDASGVSLGRYVGATFLGIAVLNWLVRNAADSPTFRAIVLGDLVLSALGLVVAVLDGVQAQGNALRWTTVIIYLLLTLGFGYLQFMAPKGGAK